MKDKILITGINGFVGNEVANLLCNQYDVWGIGRQSYSKNPLHTSYEQVDLTDEKSMLDYASRHRFDHIVHCAASLSFNDTKTLFDANIAGVYNLLKVADMTGVKSIVYISSLPVIGVPLVLPITESHPVNPRTNYHLSKYIGELLLQNNPHLNAISLRIPSPVGIGMPTNKILPVFIRNCIDNTTIELLGKGGRKQNYIDVRDIARAVALALQKNCSGVYNIASDKSVSNLELAEMCKSVLHYSTEIVFKVEDADEDLKWDVSIEKAKTELGFIPLYKLEDTIKDIARSL